jgi:hypothetical protein
MFANLGLKSWKYQAELIITASSWEESWWDANIHKTRSPSPCRISSPRAQLVASGVLPAKRAGMVKGKKTYKLATKNTVERSNQINLLLYAYHALDVHSSRHGKTEAKWKELHSKFDKVDGFHSN